jgi:hypothetical protein
VIPTMILFGLAFGRWWKWALVVAAILWPSLLWAEDVITTPGEAIVAAFLGGLNSAVGVGAHQLVLRLVRVGRDRWLRSAAAK